MWNIIDYQGDCRLTNGSCLNVCSWPSREWVAPAAKESFAFRYHPWDPEDANIRAVGLLRIFGDCQPPRQPILGAIPADVYRNQPQTAKVSSAFSYLPWYAL